MNGDAAYTDINSAKASMDHVYDEADPRAYFRELEPLEYAVPGGAKPFFQKIISYLQRYSDETVNILDLGCSYGVNAALLKHDLSMDDLYRNWSQPSLQDATPEEVVAHDRRFFASFDDTDDIRVVGLDPARNAVTYGELSGLLDAGFPLDLETQQLPHHAIEDLGPVELVISTGCVGYVTETSFRRLMPAVSQGAQPWLANFVLRMFPFETIELTLADRDYVTEKLEGRTFKQRRFVSAEEQAEVVARLQSQGLDPAGKEADGYLHAELFLSRPRADALKMPIEALFAEAGFVEARARPVPDVPVPDTGKRVEIR